MSAIAEEFPDMSIDEVFSRSIWVGNSRDLYRGFSPLQHASGRTPDEDMRMFETTDEKPVNADIYEDGGFGQNMRATRVAEKAFIDEQARQRIERASLPQRLNKRMESLARVNCVASSWRQAPSRCSGADSPCKERYLTELEGPVELPWTISKLATDPKRRTYVDLEPEGAPPEEELLAPEGEPRW